MSTAEGGGNIVRDGMVLFLDAANTKSYISGSTTWNDLSRNDYNGVLTNGPTFSSGNGGSLLFDGSNDYVALGIPSALKGVQVPLTITAWAKSTTTSGSNTIYSAYKNYTGGGQLYMLLRVDSSTFNYFTSDPGGNFQAISYTATINAGVWYNYSVVISGTTSAPSATMYLNGVPQQRSLLALTNSPDLTVDFRIGGSQFGLGEYFAGNIAQIVQYNRVLSPAEILQNYNATKGRYGL